MKLSVIIPSYNESVAIKEQAIESIDQFLKQQKYSYEVLIVDDQSTNGTLSLVEKLCKKKKNFKLIKNSHGGKAITVMSGMISSKGDVAVFTDMDQATPIGEVNKLIVQFDKGQDIVIGSRLGRKGAPVLRKLAAFVFAMLRNVILGLPFSDTQCGFKGFNRKAINMIFPEMLKRWEKSKASGAAVNAGFDVETLFIAKKKDLKIADVAVEWHHVGTEQVQLIKDSLDAIKDMLRIKLNEIAGKYD